MPQPTSAWAPDPRASIVATFHPQRWGGSRGDSAEPDGPTRKYDVTEVLLGWELSELRKINDNQNSSDLAVPHTMHRHNGPYYVYVEDSLCDFFGVEQVSDITRQQLESARRARHIGEEREFEVEMTRIASRHARVVVRATSTDEAKARALNMAGDTQFSSEDDYRFEVSAVEEMDAAPASKRSPKP